MKIFTTIIHAVDPRKDDNIIKEWDGPRIKAESWAQAEQYCQDNGLGYLCVTGEWIRDIPVKRRFDLN